VRFSIERMERRVSRWYHGGHRLTERERVSHTRYIMEKGKRKGFTYAVQNGKGKEKGKGFGTLNFNK